MLMLEAGIASTEGVPTVPGNGGDPIKEVLLLPVLKNDDSTCVVGGLNDLNGDLSETFPSVFTKLDLSDNEETEPGAAAEVVPKLKVMAEENAGRVDEMGEQLELAAAKLLFDENKLTGERGIASDVEAAKEDDNEDECTKPLLWVDVIDAPKAMVSVPLNADTPDKVPIPEDLCKPASCLPLPLKRFELSNCIFLTGLQTEELQIDQQFCNKLVIQN